jgi:TPP-dependent indolepyruvate ferredoxin oxidoreductase alpha subunit
LLDAARRNFRFAQIPVIDPAAWQRVKSTTADGYDGAIAAKGLRAYGRVA